MSFRAIISIATAVILIVACISEAFAARGARGGGVARGPRGGAVAVRGGAVRGGAYRGGAVAYRGGAYRGYGVGAAAVGAAAVGAAAAAPYYYNRQCGYYPYPPCY